MNPTLSVIVPIYHTHRFIKRCVSSILQSSFKDFEIICVLDGESDPEQQKCARIVKRFSQKDSRVRLLAIPHAGVEAARFSGIELSRGDFLVFVDSDDWIDQTMLEKMMAAHFGGNFDYVEVNAFKGVGPFRLSKRSSSSRTQEGDGLVLSAPQLMNQYYCSFLGVNVLSVSIWGKCYRRELLRRSGVKPTGFHFGEDLFFNMTLFPYLTAIKILDYRGYVYRIGGGTSHYMPYFLQDCKKQYFLKCQAIEKHNFTEGNATVRIEMMNIFKTYLCSVLYWKKPSPTEMIALIEQELSESFWEDVLSPVANHPMMRLPFFDAMQQRNASRLFEEATKATQKKIWRQRFVRLFSLTFRN